MLAEDLKTILLVEDDAITSLVETVTIKGFGYDVVIAKNGITALQIIQSNPQINLVLMDIDLGSGMDGPETARRILEIKSIPIVFLTSHSEKDIVQTVKGITRYGYVIKNSGNFVLESTISMAFELFEAHQRAEESEGKYRRLADNAPDVIYRRSLLNRRIEYISPACFATTGYTQQEFYDDPGLFEKILHPDSRENYIAESAKIKQGNLQPSYVYKILTKSGQCKWINQNSIYFRDEHNKPVATEGIARDITEMKISRELIIQSEKKYKNIFEQAVEGIFQTTPEGKFITLNPACFKMFGYESADEMQQKITNIAEQIYANPQDRENLRQLLASQQSVSNFEVQALRKDGSLIWVLINLREVNDELEGKLYYEGTVYDITEKKQNEAKIDSLLQEKEILLREVQHRVKNNVNAMISLLSLQADSYSDTNTSEALLNAANRMRSMSILYDKLYNAPNSRNISIKDYLEPLISEILLVYLSNVKITPIVNIPDITFRVRTIWSLGIIINELITNMMKYAFSYVPNPILTVEAYLQNEDLILSVADNGIGLPPEINLDRNRGFGLTLVGLMARQIDANYEIFRENGTKFVFSMKYYGQ